MQSDRQTPRDLEHPTRAVRIHVSPVVRARGLASCAVSLLSPLCVRAQVSGHMVGVWEHGRVALMVRAVWEEFCMVIISFLGSGCVMYEVHVFLNSMFLDLSYVSHSTGSYALGDFSACLSLPPSSSSTPIHTHSLDLRLGTTGLPPSSCCSLMVSTHNHMPWPMLTPHS